MYRQYTHCVSVGNYIGNAAVQVIVAAAIAAIPLLAGATVGPALLLIALAAIIAYCRWWLYGRLICLDGGAQVCAIGMFVRAEPPEQKSFLDRFDTDYSINILLAPHQQGELQDKIENDGIQGVLIKNQHNIQSAGLDFAGYTALPPSGWGNRSAVLHCEFEGGGVYDLLLACLIALGIAVAATVICAIPLIGWVVCLILSLIALAVVGVGIGVALSDTANPSDVNANLGELEFGDVLLVKGSWVYDSAHDGWNEIHPITYCQKVGKVQLTAKGFGFIADWDALIGGDIKAWIKKWCDGTGTADDPLTIANQDKPENLWTIHPLIDGCQPATEEPADIPK
jgi:hypothetical protein